MNNIRYELLSIDHSISNHYSQHSIIGVYMDNPFNTWNLYDHIFGDTQLISKEKRPTEIYPYSVLLKRLEVGEDVEIKYIGIVYIGNSFPFEIASEYIKLRPLIWIGKLKDMLKVDQILTYFQIDKKDDLGYIIFDIDSITLYKLKTDRSPIFNYTAGNLFQFSLRELLPEIGISKWDF